MIVIIRSKLVQLVRHVIYQRDFLCDDLLLLYLFFSLCRSHGSFSVSSSRPTLPSTRRKCLSFFQVCVFTSNWLDCVSVIPYHYTSSLTILLFWTSYWMVEWFICCVFWRFCVICDVTIYLIDHLYRPRQLCYLVYPRKARDMLFLEAVVEGPVRIGWHLPM